MSDLSRKIRAAVGMVIQMPNGSTDQLADAANLLSDLGVTSLELVDLALHIEDALGIAEFPLQEWIDAQVALGDQGFTVGSLIGSCEEILSRLAV